MTNFEEGAQLKCINLIYGDSEHVQVGEIYTLNYIDSDGNLVLKGVDSCWTPSQFELCAEPHNFKVGDTLICMNIAHPWLGSDAKEGITVGKTYVVSSDSESESKRKHREETFDVIAVEGLPYVYPTSMFEQYKLKPPKPVDEYAHLIGNTYLSDGLISYRVEDGAEYSFDFKLISLTENVKSWECSKTNILKWVNDGSFALVIPDVVKPKTIAPIKQSVLEIATAIHKDLTTGKGTWSKEEIAELHYKTVQDILDDEYPDCNFKAKQVLSVIRTISTNLATSYDGVCFKVKRADVDKLRIYTLHATSNDELYDCSVDGGKPFTQDHVDFIKHKFAEGTWVQCASVEPVKLVKESDLVGLIVSRGGKCSYTLSEGYNPSCVKLTWNTGTEMMCRTTVCNYINNGTWKILETIPMDFNPIEKHVQENYVKIQPEFNVNQFNQPGEYDMQQEQKSTNTIGIQVASSGFAVTSVTTINGRDVSTLNETQIMDIANDIVAQQETLKASNKTLKSSRIKNKINALGKTRNALIKYMDSMEDENASVEAEPTE